MFGLLAVAGLQATSAATSGVRGTAEVPSFISTATAAMREKAQDRFEAMVAKDKAAIASGKGIVDRSLATVEYNTGYIYINQYADETCKTATFQYGYHLGACRTESDTSSFYYTATVDGTDLQYILNTFATSDCTGDAVTGFDNSAELGACQSDYPMESYKFFITTSESAWTTLGSNYLTNYYDDVTECATGMTKNSLEYQAIPIGVCIPTSNVSSIKYSGCSSTSYSGAEYDSVDCGRSVGSGTAEFDAACSANDDDDGTGNIAYETESCYKSSSDDSSTCFHGDSTVRTESGETKKVSSVAVGDRVLTVNGAGESVYADVVFVPHSENAVEATFVNLKTSSGHSVRMTQEHMIPAGSCMADAASLPFVRAEDVRVGSCVHTTEGMQEVVSASQSKSAGIYTIVTSESNGLVVVDGVTASSFGVSHKAANAYYHLHRAAYAVLNVAGLHGALGASLLVRANALFGDLAVFVGKTVRLV